MPPPRQESIAARWPNRRAAACVKPLTLDTPQQAQQPGQRRTAVRGMRRKLKTSHAHVDYQMPPQPNDCPAPVASSKDRSPNVGAYDVHTKPLIASAPRTATSLDRPRPT